MAGTPNRGDALIKLKFWTLPTPLHALYVPPGWTVIARNKPTIPTDLTNYIRKFVGPVLHVFEGTSATHPFWTFEGGPKAGQPVNKDFGVPYGRLDVPCTGEPWTSQSSDFQKMFSTENGNVKIDSLQFMRTGDPWETADQTAQRKLCNGQWHLSIAGVPYRHYSPHSFECDEIMDSYCNFQNFQLPECACYADAHDLQKKYGGSISLPVTCFGKRCAAGGYRTRHMMAETCHATLCREIIETSGTELSLDGENDIYCAGSFYQVTGEGLPTPSPSIPSPSVTREEKQDKTIPAFMWAVLALSIVFFGIVFYFVIKSTKVPKS